MSDEIRTKRYERCILPHSSAAYNLAHWLLGNAQDAEDVTQEAFVRAYKHLDRLRGEEACAWLLTIVRNECYDWLRQHRAQKNTLSLELTFRLFSPVRNGVHRRFEIGNPNSNEMLWIYGTLVQRTGYT